MLTDRPSLRSRTVPTKLHTAPLTPNALAQGGDFGGEVEILRLDADTGSHGRRPCLSHRSSGKTNLGALHEERRLIRHDLVQRQPHRSTTGQLSCRRRHGDEFVAQARQCHGAGFDGFARPVQCFADGGEIADRNSHASNSEKGMNETKSP